MKSLELDGPRLSVQTAHGRLAFFPEKGFLWGSLYVKVWGALQQISFEAS